MKCPKCNYESTQDFEYCPYCGSSTSDLSVSLNPAADRILKPLTDPLFLLICIFISASTVFSILSGSSFPIISILLCIFLWLTFSAAKKGFADEKPLKYISGTIYADYIVTNILAVLLLVSGGLCSFLLSIASKEEGLIDSLVDSVTSGMPEDVTYLLTIILNMSGWLLFAIFAILAIIIFVINIVFTKRIHLFAKSIYKSIESGNFELHNPVFARTVLIILGVLSLVSALGSFTSLSTFLSSVTIGLAEIFASILVGKYLIHNEGETHYESI